MALTVRENLQFEALMIYFAKKLIQQFSKNYMQLNNKKYFYIWKLSITGPTLLHNKIAFQKQSYLKVFSKKWYWIDTLEEKVGLLL